MEKPFVCAPGLCRCVRCEGMEYCASENVTGRARLIRFCEVSVKCFPIISCLKYTVNSNFHLIKEKYQKYQICVVYETI